MVSAFSRIISVVRSAASNVIPVPIVPEEKLIPLVSVPRVFLISMALVVVPPDPFLSFNSASVWVPWVLVDLIKLEVLVPVDVKVETVVAEEVAATTYAFSDAAGERTPTDRFQ